MIDFTRGGRCDYLTPLPKLNYAIMVLSTTDRLLEIWPSWSKSLFEERWVWRTPWAHMLEIANRASESCRRFKSILPPWSWDFPTPNGTRFDAIFRGSSLSILKIHVDTLYLFFFFPRNCYCAVGFSIPVILVHRRSSTITFHLMRNAHAIQPLIRWPCQWPPIMSTGWCPRSMEYIYIYPL